MYNEEHTLVRRDKDGNATHVTIFGQNGAMQEYKLERVGRDEFVRLRNNQVEETKI